MKSSGAFLELAKPRLTMMALATAFTAFYLASSPDFDWGRLFGVLIGAALIGGGANALNQCIEKEIDARMKRTEKRPLPSGRLRTKQALLFGLILSALGVLNLFLFVNPLTAFLGAATLLLYVLVYTPMKRKTPLNTFVGAIPGALPCLIGWAGARGEITPAAWSLFLFLFVWQLPHFFAIAWFYRDDYKKGGLRMAGGEDEKGLLTRTLILVCTAALFAVSLLPFAAGLVGLAYLFTAIFLGSLLLGLASYIAFGGLAEARKFIPASIFYLFMLNITMVTDKVR